MTPYVGFRTFIVGERSGRRGKGDGESFIMEPFSPENSKMDLSDDDETKPERTMYVGTNELEIVEEDNARGVSTAVNTLFCLRRTLPPS